MNSGQGPHKSAAIRNPINSILKFLQFKIQLSSFFRKNISKQLFFRTRISKQFDSWIQIAQVSESLFTGRELQQIRIHNLEISLNYAISKFLNICSYAIPTCIRKGSTHHSWSWISNSYIFLSQEHIQQTILLKKMLFCLNHFRNILVKLQYFFLIFLILDILNVTVVE